MFEAKVIWANSIPEAFGECCGEVLVLFWLRAGWAGRALGRLAAMVLNGLSSAVKFVAPFVFRLFGCICPLCFLLLLFISTFSRIMRLLRAEADSESPV